MPRTNGGRWGWTSKDKQEHGAETQVGSEWRVAMPVALRNARPPGIEWIAMMVTAYDHIWDCGLTGGRETPARLTACVPTASLTDQRMLNRDSHDSPKAAKSPPMESSFPLQALGLVPFIPRPAPSSFSRPSVSHRHALPPPLAPRDRGASGLDGRGPGN